MLTSSKENFQLSKSRYHFFYHAIKMDLLMFQLFRWGVLIYWCQHLFLATQRNLNLLVGKASDSVTSKDLKNKRPWEVTPHNVLDTHHFALLYDCIYAHVNKLYHLWSVFFLFFQPLPLFLATIITMMMGPIIMCTTENGELWTLTWWDLNFKGWNISQSCDFCDMWVATLIFEF